MMSDVNLSQPFASPKLTCPTCKVAFSHQTICRRCGSDLSLLMNAAIRAWELREQARQNLQAGQFDEAYQLAVSAQSLHRTSWGDWIIQYSQCGKDIQSRDR